MPREKEIIFNGIRLPPPPKVLYFAKTIFVSYVAALAVLTLSVTPFSTSGLTVAAIVEVCKLCTGVTAGLLLTFGVNTRKKHLIMAPPSPPKYAAVQTILAKTTPTHISKISVPESILVSFPGIKYFV